MGRIRSIKPELIAQERVANLSDAAYRLYVGCLSLADDAGNLPGSARYLNGQIFYGRSRNATVLGRLAGELEAARLVDQYTCDGASYLSIIGWSEKGCPAHQRIDKPQAPQFPRPTSVRSWNEFAERSQTDPIRSETIREEGTTRARGDAREAAAPRISGSAVDLFTRRFQEANAGALPTWGRQQTNAITALIATHGEPEVVRRIEIMFGAPPAWLRPPFDVSTLARHFDKLATPTARKERPDISGNRPENYLKRDPDDENVWTYGPDGEEVSSEAAGEVDKQGANP